MKGAELTRYFRYFYRTLVESKTAASSKEKQSFSMAAQLTQGQMKSLKDGFDPAIKIEYPIPQRRRLQGSR